MFPGQNLNLPKEIGKYKVVQLYVLNEEMEDPGEPYLVFGKKNLEDENNEEYHSQILENFLDAMEIDFEKEIEGMEKIPKPEGEGYNAVGMSWAVIETKGKIEFCGFSSSYKMRINEKHLRKMEEYGIFPSGLELEVSNRLPNTNL